MRFDLPHELLRRRQPESPETPPLEPSPIELHGDRLRDQREHVRQLNLHREPTRTKDGSPQYSPQHSQPDARRAVAHDHQTSRRPRRNNLPVSVIGPSLRPEEITALGEIGRFRVVSTRDLAASVYDGQHSRLTRDLRFLTQQGLVQVESVNARRDGRAGKVEPIEVVTLTEEGRRMARQLAGLPEDQRLYSGLVKPREVEHDAQIYRAYRKESERIENAGGTNLRVRLDFEMKAQIQKAIYAERKADPERDMNEIKQQVAQQFELPFVGGGIQIPDARIEYDLDQGSRSGHADVEVLTAAYRPGHLHNKAQAGFRLYASASDRSTLTAKIEDEHHLLDRILEL
ncbi:MAG TPA: hypothetical protein VN577_11725 [Terriglobales bacterium]|nr:hypothetical protein [Terriglobales bacterium]